MFSSGVKNDLFESLVQNDRNSSEVEILGINTDNIEFREELHNIVDEQLNSSNAIRVDVVNQIMQSNCKEKKQESLETLLSFLTASSGMEIDFYKAKTDLNELVKYTRTVYDILYYDAFNILSRLVERVFVHNTNVIDELFRNISKSKSKIDINKLKKNTDDNIKDSYKVFFLLDDIFRDEQSFKLLFKNELLYDNLPPCKSEQSFHQYILDLQTADTICNIISNIVFRNSLQTSLFLSQLKIKIILHYKDSGE